MAVYIKRIHALQAVLKKNPKRIVEPNAEAAAPKKDTNKPSFIKSLKE